MEFKSMLRRVVGGSAAVAAVGATLMAPASAAPAPEGEFGVNALFQIKHPNANNCLDNGDGDVFLYMCDNADSQQWNNYAPGRFRNDASGLCLASNGVKVFTMDCGTPSSTWTTTSTNPKLLRHGVKTSKCLTTKSSVAGRFAYMIDCAEATRWVIS